MRGFEVICALALLVVQISSCRVNAEKIAKENSASHRRASRAASDSQTPNPLDCRLSPWSEWSPCFACQEKRYRYRSLVQPSKFSGTICSGYPWGEEACTPAGKCASRDQCGEDFQCQETGRCIKRNLVCNGEPDCRDSSDEADCEEVFNESFCKDLFPIPGSENAVKGFNVLTQEHGQYVFDPKYFGGRCEYVYNGEWRDLKYDAACERLYYGDDEKYFRKPFNFHVYHFLAHADSGSSSEYYDDAKDLLNAIKQDHSSFIGFTFGISPADSPVGIQYGVKEERAHGSLSNITKYDSKNVGFVRVRTKVQTARFSMRKNNIVLDEDFLQSLMDLPDQYNYGMYAKFINDYGTHFVTSGTMGGIFEYILVLNKEFMKSSAISEATASKCSSVSIGITTINEEQTLEATITATQKECEKFGSASKVSDSKESAVEDIISLVRGGDTGSSGGLTNIWNADTYRHWGRSLKYNPAVIDFEIQPMHEILRRANLKNIDAKQQNLKRAMDEYLSEFNACRCGPCQNNGEPILIGTNCACQCPNQFDGVACEKTTRTGTKVNGNWSCWAPWSQCQSRARTRRRQCNNPAPKDGGASCVGKNMQTDAC
ncbi:complement component C8 alpha chain [Ambystoma mexicanum]|uniref:complement component C8 alpha chain n=1 Tax=Ambystoma mexicanum TaxID=8296 RepID=UPI0037E735AB